jgi:hypothetical protein
VRDTSWGHVWGARGERFEIHAGTMYIDIRGINLSRTLLQSSGKFLITDMI